MYTKNTNHPQQGQQQRLLVDWDGGGGDKTTTLLASSRAAAAAPLALHTHWQLPRAIALEELTGSSKQGRGGQKQQPAPKLPLALPVDHRQYPHRWLGETVVNQLVRDAIDTYYLLGAGTTAAAGKHNPKRRQHILDVGCGIGGTLYALWPSLQSQQQSLESPSSFRYHGIAVSAAEIQLARQQADFYLRQNDRDQALYNHPNVVFRQQSFDQSFSTIGNNSNNHNNNYTVAVAIESLSFSRNLEKTLTHIVDALDVGGLLIVVDDVVLHEDDDDQDDDDHLRPSLLPHTAWRAAFGAAGCSVVLQRDLSLQYELSRDGAAATTTTKYSSDRYWRWSVPPVPWDAATQRLLELRDEQAALDRWTERRRRGLDRTAALAYHLYVCVKNNN